MKIYNLDVNTAQPIRQTVQMQQNATGILNVTVKNDGKYIRNMTCKVYDSNTEISATSESGGTFGFKLNVGTESKNLKVVATSTPLESTAKSVINIGTGKRVQQKPAIKMQIPAGTYSQTEFIPAMQFLLSHSNGSVTLLLGTLDGDQIVTYTGESNFDTVEAIRGNQKLGPLFPDWMKTNQDKIVFRKRDGNNWGYNYLTPDKTLYLSEDAVAWMNVSVKPPNEEYSYTDYPAIGYYTDYSMDMLIKPTMNAQAFAEKEMLPENADFISLSADSISLSGVTYVPTGLSVGDAVYTVLAAVQPETPEQPADPEGE